MYEGLSSGPGHTFNASLSNDDLMSLWDGVERMSNSEGGKNDTEAGGNEPGPA
jgi:hypothetical protein